MKRIILTAALLLSLVLILGACGKQEEPAALQWPDLDPQLIQNDILVGTWRAENGYLELDGVEGFQYDDYEGNASSGRYVFDGETLYLEDGEGTVRQGRLDEQENLILEGETFYSPWVVYLDMIVGKWTYQRGDLVLDFAQDGSFTWTHRGTAGEGSYLFDGTYLYLGQGDSFTETGYMDYECNIHVKSLAGYFYSETGTPYFPLMEENQELLTPELPPVSGRHPVENAVAFVREDPAFYTLMDGDWSVEQERIPMDNSQRSCYSVTATCYLPLEYQPELPEAVETRCSFALFDRYTGQIFPAGECFLGEDGRYHYLFDSRDGRVDLTVTMERDTGGPVADCFGTMLVNLTVDMPAWYDGLAFAAMPMPQTQEEMQQDMDRDSEPYQSGMLLFPRDRVGHSRIFSIGGSR